MTFYIIYYFYNVVFNFNWYNKYNWCINQKSSSCSVYTDDESFGCGGFIKKLSKQNYNIKAVSFTDGISSRIKNEKKILDRISSANKAAKILGFQWIKNFYYPDNSLDAIPLIKIIKIIEEIKKKFNPEILITHNFTDLNIDHRIIAEACLTAFRPEPNSKLKKFITFEVPSSTDFRIIKKINNFWDNFFVDWVFYNSYAADDDLVV